MDQSLENLGYTQAVSNDTLEDKAHEAITKIPGFPETCPDESKAALVSGYRKRYAEKNPSETYAVIDGNYVLATPDMEKNKKVEKLEIGVEYAFSFTTHEYGKMTQENPALRKIIQGIREKTQDYCSNRFNDLKRAAKKILRKDSGVKREEKTFKESAEKVFDDWEKSVKTKSSRGDKTARPDRFKLAVTAFWSTYNS